MQQKIAEAVAAAVAAPNDLTEEASERNKIPLVLLHSVLLTHLLPSADTCNVSGPLDTLQVTTRLPTLICPAPSHLGTGLQLRVQIDKLRHRIAGLEEELASERKASAKTLDDARSQVEGLRTLNQTVRKCI